MISLGFGVSLVKLFSAGGIKPGAGAASWTGYAPTTSGIAFSVALPGFGVALWQGYALSVSIGTFVLPAVGTATWTGPAPAITGLISANAINWGPAQSDYIAWGTTEITWGP